MPENSLKFPFEHEIAIVSMMKNEEDYILEWLEYHRLAGVTKFFIYDNESTDSTKELLQPYIESGLVEHTLYDGSNLIKWEGQINCFNLALDEHKFAAEYIAVIDADEYIYPRTGMNIPQTVKSIVSRAVPNCSGLSANWRNFGSSGHKNKDLSQGLLARFVRRASDDSHIHGNLVVKTISNPRRVDFCRSPHYPVFFNNCCAVNERLQPMMNAPLSLSPINIGAHENLHDTAELIRVNHYPIKSREEWLVKQAKNNKLRENNNAYKEDYFVEADTNECFDDGIVRYREQLRRGEREHGGFEPRKHHAGYIETIKERLENVAREPATVLGIEDVLGYWRIAHKFSVWGQNRGVKVRLEHLLLDKLAQSFGGRCAVWDVQLFLREAPRLMQDSEEARRRVPGFVKQWMPMLTKYCKDDNDWIHGKKYDCLSAWISALD